MNATYRRFEGVARELGHTSLAANATAAATTLVLVNATGFASTSKVTIYDGLNTEVVTASALVGTTLTVGATANAHTAGCVVTTCGTTSAGPQAYAPVKTFDPKDDRTRLPDQGWRGVPADTFGMIDGVASSEASLAGDFFPDTSPYFLFAVLGAIDFTGGTPNTHLGALNCKGDTQGSYLQLTDVYLPNVSSGIVRQYSVKVTDFVLTFTADGMLSWTSSVTGYASGLVALPSSSFSSEVPLATYIGTIKVGGVLTPLIVDGSIEWKRDADVVANIDGNIAPYSIFQGPLGVTGKVQVIAEDETWLTYYENNTQPTLELAWSNGAAAGALRSIDAFFNQIAFTDGPPDASKSHLEYALDYEAIANSTDANTAGGGLSPGRVTVRNILATGTYG